MPMDSERERADGDRLPARRNFPVCCAVALAAWLGAAVVGLRGLPATGIPVVLALGAVGTAAACLASAIRARAGMLASVQALRRRWHERSQAVRLMQDIVNSSADAIYARDSQCRFIFANRQACAMLGLDQDAVLGQPVEALFPAHQAAEIRRSDEAIMRDGQARTSETTVAAGTSDLHIALTKSALCDASGQCIGVCAVGRDMTARRLEEETLRQWAMAFESMRDGVMITDTAARIIKVNRALCAITGYTQDELIGNTPKMLRSGRHGADFYRDMWRELRLSGHWQGEVWNRRSNGEVFPQILTLSAVRDADHRVVNYVSVATDITQVKRSEARLEQLALYDPLTNLPNRACVHRMLERALSAAKRHGGEVAVLYIDLDGFKTVNDSLGHPAGDELLLAVANRLTIRLRDIDKLGRLGGDEFLVILEHIKEPAEAAVVARDLLAALAAPVPLVCGRAAYVTASIGISVLSTNPQATPVELLRDADAAMYRAKDQGRNRSCFYTSDLNSDAVARLELESALSQALAREELLLHYQPKVDATSGCIVGVEALLRWRRDGKLEPPGQFIPIAERSSLILDIGAWVIDQACAQWRAWQDAGLPAPRIAVNVAARQFAAGDLDVVLTDALARHGIPGSALEVELTEGILMDNPGMIAPMLQRIRALGVQLALDDFGTGYSNLGYLQKFPLDFLKIDQSFVRALGGDLDGAAIVDAIIVLAHRLGLRVIAEGVETDEQRAHLAAQGCDQMQGYLFCRPVDAAALAARLEAMTGEAVA